jgi:hypothetical protein
MYAHPKYPLDLILFQWELKQGWKKIIITGQINKKSWQAIIIQRNNDGLTLLRWLPPNPVNPD